MFKSNVKAETSQSFNSAALVAGWNLVAYSDHPDFLLRIINGSNTLVEVSYDGVTLNDAIPANTAFQIYTQTNSLPNAKVALFSKNLGVWIRGTAGVGTIYVAGYYVDTM
jgi:hypothetical protein